jgi:hypothetical protein
VPDNAFLLRFGSGHGGVPSGAHGHASSRGEAEVAGTFMPVAAPHKSIENKSVENGSDIVESPRILL